MNQQLDTGSAREAMDKIAGLPVTIEILIPRSWISDIACSAFEGGSTYWAIDVHVPRWIPSCHYASEVVGMGGDVWVGEECEASGEVVVYHRLTAERLLQGMLKRASQVGQTIENWVDNHDAEDADCALQYALFGEIVYG